jgi:hypothetical protein
MVKAAAETIVENEGGETKHTHQPPGVPPTSGQKNPPKPR